MPHIPSSLFVVLFIIRVKRELKRVFECLVYYESINECVLVGLFAAE